MDVLEQLKRDFVIQGFPSNIRRDNPEPVELRYCWPGTPGVKYLKLIQVADWADRTDTRELTTLSKSASSCKIGISLKEKGFYRLRIQAVLSDDSIVDTQIMDTPAVRGPIPALRYSHKRAVGGWQVVQIHTLDELTNQFYGGHLWLEYGGCRHRYPENCGRPMSRCYIPWDGAVNLSVDITKLPKPIDAK